jgi:hypothetical protein
MRQVIKLNKIPEYSICLKEPGKIDYVDIYQICKETNDSIDAIITRIFSLPKGIIWLLKVRNSVVGAWGLKTGYADGLNIEPYYPIDSRAVYFTVSERNDNEIIVAESDTHLSFRVSVFVERNRSSATVYLSTIVKYNNKWGWLYFSIIKPFHRIIIKSCLKRYANE